MKRFFSGRVFASGVFFIVLTGCVRTVERPEPLARSSLVITRTGPTATLTWESETHVLYTVMQKNRSSSRSAWKPVEPYMNLRGTGGRMQAVDRTPRGENRKYRLHMVPFRKPSRPVASPR